MSTPTKILLKSSDGEVFEVDEAVALESQTIKHLIEDDCAGSNIPLPNVTSKILAKVIEYSKRHVEASSKTEDKAAEDELKVFDAEFVKVDQGTLFDLILVWFQFYCGIVFIMLIFYGFAVLILTDCWFICLIFCFRVIWLVLRFLFLMLLLFVYSV